MAVAGSWASLAEAQLLTRSDFVSGVVAEVIKAGGILSRLPVRQVHGQNLVYNRENIVPTGNFHAIADQWTASEDLDHTQITVTLAIHGDQKNIDDFIKQTYDNENDMEAVVLSQTAKGLRNEMERLLIYEATAFSGLHSLVTSNQTGSMGSGSTGAALTQTVLNRMLDMVRPKADFLLGPYRIIQRLDQAGEGGTTSYPVVMVMEQGGAGRRMATRAGYWRDSELIRSDFMATANTGALQETIASGVYSAETGGATGSLFGFHPGLPEDTESGVFLAMGSKLFEQVGPFASENRNAEWVRVRTYIAPGLASSRGLMIVDGITDAQFDN